MLMGNRDEVKKVLVEELGSLRQRIIDNHIRAGQKASGRTIASLNVSVDDNHGRTSSSRGQCDKVG